MRDKNHVILDVETCAEEVEEYYNLDDDGWEDEVTHEFFSRHFFWGLNHANSSSSGITPITSTPSVDKCSFNASNIMRLPSFNP